MDKELSKLYFLILKENCDIIGQLICNDNISDPIIEILLGDPKYPEKVYLEFNRENASQLFHPLTLDDNRM